jgi:DNA-binding NarL/FixJ family response regulator
MEAKILIIDDHPLLREGIRGLLESLDEKFQFEIEEAGSAEEGIKKVQKNNYDVILMDYQLPKMNGGDAARAILKINPQIKILGMSGYNEYPIFDFMHKSGIHGFVLKTVGPEELVHAIETILNGDEYYCNEIWVKMKKHYSDDVHPESKKYIKIHNKLTKRENEILKLSLEPLSNKEIAEKLFISIRTVETHRSKIMKKLNIQSPAHLLRYAELYSNR